jgi:hypothetical protein
MSRAARSLLMYFCENDILSLTEINGITIEEIERRAQPLEDKTLDPQTWRCRSSSGFLGENEKFKDVLLLSFNELKKIGISNQDIAFHLRSILEKAESKRKKLKVGPSVPIKITHPSYPLPSKKNEKLEFSVEKIFFMGSQQSLFYNANIKESKENLEWKNDFIITNTRSGKSLKIGGNTECGIIRYIEEYGFYESGENNDYKLTPIDILSLLTS